MMTNFSENLLGIFYRRRNKDGEWSGGPMYYLKDGLGKYYGNMAQINKIVLNMDAAFFVNVDLGVLPGTQIDIVHLIIGAGLLVIAAMIIIGGLMMIPNLIGVVALLPLVLKITRNYVDRKIRGKDVAPILSYDETIQQEMADKLSEDD